jgi:hypothetical protein
MHIIYVFICPMEFFSLIKKNEMMLFAGKWIKLEIIMLSEEARLRKTDIACSFSYVESRP